MALIRKNIQMSEEVAKWYEERSKEMGVSQSALMTIALKQYLDQDKAMNVMSKFEKMINDVKKLQESIDK